MIFSVLKSNLFIRALLLDRILVTEKTTRTPRVHLVIIDFTIALCRWGVGGPVTKYSLRLAALSYSAYQASPNYNNFQCHWQKYCQLMYKIHFVSA